jgi:hypothetical protein
VGLPIAFSNGGGRMPTRHFGALDTPLQYSVFDTRFPFIQPAASGNNGEASRTARRLEAGECDAGATPEQLLDT